MVRKAEEATENLAQGRDGNKPASFLPQWEDPYNRTTFIRELTRDLFIERVRGYQGKVTGDYAQYAYQSAVAVADILELED